MHLPARQQSSAAFSKLRIKADSQVARTLSAGQEGGNVNYLISQPGKEKKGPPNLLHKFAEVMERQERPICHAAH